MTQATNPTFTLISAADLAARLRDDPGVTLVDVRNADEWHQVRIDHPGIRHIPLGELPQRAGELPRDVPLIVYCLSGGRSAQACRWLAAQGFATPANLEGGISAWHRAGLAVTSG